MHKLAPIFLATLFSLTLAACGGGGSATTSDDSTDTFTFGGSVGDGPIAGATVVLRNAAGKRLATTLSNAQAAYRFNVQVSPTDFPLTILTYDGTDMVSGTAPDFAMESIVQSTADTSVNINPHSTLIVKTAKAMRGGLNRANVANAKSTVMERFNFGLSDSLVADPITTRVGENNVAEIVKSSETMAEAIRRARNSLRGLGRNVTADDVINALAADLSDGALDGAGTGAADTKTTALTVVASAQVLVEALENKLKVNGKPATAAMDRAIAKTTPKARKRTGDVLITREMLDQTSESIVVAEAVQASSDLESIRAVIATLKANSRAAAIDKALPDNASNRLGNAVTATGKANDTRLGNAVRNLGNIRVIRTTTVVVEEEKSITLRWRAPASREDGDSMSLSELDGYRIYYGTKRNDLDALVDIGDSTATEYTVTLAPGVYFFALTAYDVEGLESDLSNIRRRTI